MSQAIPDGNYRNPKAKLCKVQLSTSMIYPQDPNSFHDSIHLRWNWQRGGDRKGKEGKGWGAYREGMALLQPLL